MVEPVMVSNEALVEINNGPKIKTKTRDNKAKEVLKIAIKDCTEFSLKVAESPNGVVVVAFVAHLPKESKEALLEYAR